MFNAPFVLLSWSPVLVLELPTLFLRHPRLVLGTVRSAVGASRTCTDSLGGRARSHRGRVSNPWSSSSDSSWDFSIYPSDISSCCKYIRSFPHQAGAVSDKNPLGGCNGIGTCCDPRRNSAGIRDGDSCTRSGSSSRRTLGWENNQKAAWYTGTCSSCGLPCPQPGFPSSCRGLSAGPSSTRLCKPSHWGAARLWKYVEDHRWKSKKFIC